MAADPMDVDIIDERHGYYNVRVGPVVMYADRITVTDTVIILGYGSNNAIGCIYPYRSVYGPGMGVVLASDADREHLKKNPVILEWTKDHA